MPSPLGRLGSRGSAVPVPAAHSRIVALTAVVLIALAPGSSAHAETSAPRPSTPVSSSALPAPTIDPAAPTPTSPPASVPQGYGPQGITIGGPQLDTRGRVTYAGAPAVPAEINAHGFVLADAGTGEILAAQDPHGRYYPASTLKLLTMLALYPVLDPNQVLTATVEDASVEGSRVGIVENGQYTVGQLWSALMLQSGNDAARMLTTAAGGDAAALTLMNAKATELQAYDTLAGTTSGLDIAGQSSSPYDLCILMREVASNPTLRAIDSQLLSELPAQPPKYPEPLRFGNQNKLLQTYPGALGGKTGFTDAARHTFVAAAERDGRMLVVSLMQAEHEPTPTWQQAALLLDWGFAAPADAHGAGRLVRPDEVSPTAPASSSAAQAAASEDGSSPAASPAASHSVTRSGVRDWPLLPILGLLLGVAVWIAGPRRNSAGGRHHR